MSARELALAKEGSIFKDISVLDIERYIPERLLFREQEVAKLKLTIEESLSEGGSKAVLVYGLSGTGKSALVGHTLTRDFLSELGAGVVRIRCTHNIHETIEKLATAAITQSENTRPFGKDIAQNLLQSIFTTKRYVVVLDDFEKLGNQGIKLLKFITDECGATVCAVSNHLQTINLFSRKVRDFEFIQLDRYTEGQIREIVQDRVSSAFWEGTVDDEAVDFVAKIASVRRGGVKLAISLLKTAGQRAIFGKVSADLIRHLVDSVEWEIFWKDMLSGLDTKQLILLGILLNRDVINTGELYRIANNKLATEETKTISDRMWRKYLDDLISRGVVEKWVQNRRWVVSIEGNIPRDGLLWALKKRYPSFSAYIYSQ